MPRGFSDAVGWPALLIDLWKHLDGSCPGWVIRDRHVATRYDKLAANDLAFVQLASIRLWLRVNESTSERPGPVTWTNDFTNDLDQRRVGCLEKSEFNSGAHEVSRSSLCCLPEPDMARSLAAANARRRSVVPPLSSRGPVLFRRFRYPRHPRKLPRAANRCGCVAPVTLKRVIRETRPQQAAMCL
jgi:hypothetical protein